MLRYDIFGRFLSTLEATVRPGESRPERGRLNAFSHSVDGNQWLASFEQYSSLYRLPVPDQPDSLLLNAQYAFALAAFNERKFGIAKGRATTLLATAPGHAGLWLLRGLSSWYYPVFDKTQKQEFLRNGLEDIQKAISLDQQVFEETSPALWLAAIAENAQTDSLRDAICALLPEACSGNAPSPGLPDTPAELPPVPALFDSLRGKPDADIIQAVRGDKIGFVRQGDGGGYEMMVPFMYEEAFDFVEGLAAVRQNGKWGFVDEKGKQVIAPQFDLILSRPSDPEVLACVEKAGRSFCIDREGGCINYQQYRCLISIPSPDKPPVLLPKQTDQIRTSRTPDGYIITGPYSEGLAPVRDGDRFGYIDRSQKLVIPIRFEQAGQFYNGRARVVENGKSFFIDREGKKL
ncbi:MAG: WG repeat-containing protein [Bacteroidia bacterium]